MSNDVRIHAALDDKVSSGLDRLRDKLDAVGGKGASAVFAGNVAAKGLDLIGGSARKTGELIGDFIKNSISAASDLNETLGKSQVVFGDAAKGVEDWGGTAADAFGLSKQKAIEAAASFGNVFKGLKFGEGESAKMSEKLVALAGDLASFNNIDPTEALDKLRSGLAGESEPLRSVGVFLTEAQVQAKAMQLGLAGAHGELTEGAKIVARYNLILEQTKTAQGDFARTSDGLANSQRKANAELEDMSAQLGEQMLPVQLLVTHAQLDFFKGLNLVFDGLSGKVTPATLQLLEAQIGQAKAADVARQSIGKMDQETRDAAVAMGLLTQAEIDAASGISTTARAQSDAAVAFSKSAQGMADDARESGRIGRQSLLGIKTASTDMADQVQKDSARTATYLNNLTISYRTNAKQIVGDYYDVITEQDRLSATNTELANLRKIASHRKLTADEKASLHSLEQTQSQMLEDLASHGATSSAAFQTAMNDINRRLASAHGKERVALLAEKRALELFAIQAAIANGKVLTLNQSIAGTIAKGGYISAAGAGQKPPEANNAGGGPGIAGRPTRVGEFGPETYVPDTNGYIESNSMTPGGGGGGRPLVIQFNSTWPPTPAQAREISQLVSNQITLEFDRSSGTSARQ